MRGILEGIPWFIGRYGKVKQQVKALMENECDIDPIDKEGILNSSSAEVEIHNDEIAFYMTLYSYYQMNCRGKETKRMDESSV